jgi:primosomal protein N' (replication factor Y)
LKKIHSEKYSEIKIIVLGPVTPRIAKIGGKYRGRIIIKCKNDKNFRAMISELLKEFAKDKKDTVNIFADINPESII